MISHYYRAACYIAFILLVSGCASDKFVLAPDTMAGDQLRPEYLVGRWCNNRELTSAANHEAGISTLTNLGKQFWSLRASGKWENSDTGWMYFHHGKWQVRGADTVELDSLRGDPVGYRASFRNSGADLYLQDDDGAFLVMSRCD